MVIDAHVYHRYVVAVIEVHVSHNVVIDAVIEVHVSHNENYYLLPVGTQRSSN